MAGHEDIPGAKMITDSLDSLTDILGKIADNPGAGAAEIVQDILTAGGELAKVFGEAGDRMGGTFGATLKTVEDIGTAMVALAPVMAQFAATNKIMAEQTNFAAKALFNLPKDAVNAAIAFNKATGAGGEFDDKIISLRENLKSVPGIQDAITESTAGLFKGFSDFSGPDGITKSEMQIAKTVAMLSKLGGSVQDQTSIVQNLRMGFMMNDQQINDSLLQFEAISEVLDVDLGTVMSNFAKQAPLFSTFADQGVHAFKRLQAQSKATGVEVEKLVGVSEKFVTIESAAGIVGQLQQLAPGGDLDFVALTEAALTNPSEVTNMLMDYLNDINFEILDPATQRVFSNVLDMPVPQLKALASRKVEDYEKLVKDAETATESGIAQKIMAGSEVTEVQRAITDTIAGVEGLAKAMREADKGAFQQTLTNMGAIGKAMQDVKGVQDSILEAYRGATQTVFQESDAKLKEIIKEERKEMLKAFEGMQLHVTMDRGSFKGYITNVVSGAE